MSAKPGAVSEGAEEGGAAPVAIPVASGDLKVCIYIRIYACMCMYVCVCICVYLNIYIYEEGGRHR
jgi:hypothetical protein